VKRFITAGIVLCLILAAAFMLRATGCAKRPPLSLFPLVSADDIARGEVLYNNRCRYCHGDPDKGILPRFKPFSEMGIVKGDPQILASAILFEKEHRTGTTGPALFEDMPDADIARVANYMRSRAGADQIPVRSRTVQRAREIQASQPTVRKPPEEKSEDGSPLD